MMQTIMDWADSPMVLTKGAYLSMAVFDVCILFVCFKFYRVLWGGVGARIVVPYPDLNRTSSEGYTSSEEAHGGAPPHHS